MCLYIAISITKDKIMTNCFHISNTLFLCGAYGNKLKIFYEHVISCFHKLSQVVS